MKKQMKWTAFLLMLMMVFTACGKRNTEQPEQTPSVEVTHEVTEEVTKEPTQEPTTQVTEQPVKESEKEEQSSDQLRVVSFSPSITEIIFALDAGEVLVGRTDHCDYPKEALKIETIGGFYSPDIEKIVSLEPDLVIASALWTDDVADKFKEAGIEVLVLNEASKVEDVYGIISNLGVYLNREDQATEMIESMQKEISEVTDKVKDLTPKTVYYVVGYGDGGDFTATGDTYINDMLTMAGGDNIAKDATGWSYSLESLIENDPEVILIGSQLKDDFMSMDSYKNLSAVKNGRVYGVDDNLLSRQTNRTPQGILEIAKILHPEVFK